MTRESQAKRDAKYLAARRGGLPPTAIARKYNISLRTVYRGIERARLLEQPAGAEYRRAPRLVPLCPITPLTPESICPHGGPIRKGSIFVCMICHQSGLDHLKYFRSHPRDPKPDRKAWTAKAKPKTRKERRKAA